MIVLPLYLLVQNLYAFRFVVFLELCGPQLFDLLFDKTVGSYHYNNSARHQQLG
jgi:hypothetical protein